MKIWAHKRDAKGNVVTVEVLQAFNEPFDYLQGGFHDGEAWTVKVNSLVPH